MLNYILKDLKQKQTILKHPLSVNLVSSADAPADSLTICFAVKGKIPVISSIVIENNGERIFCGLIDSQTDEQTQNGLLLTLNARSLASVLLDNEALPQTYCMPSMPLIMKRHFSRLGFNEYIGTSKGFNGEIAITKGMSEWAVLELFCRSFLKTKPKIDSFGVIDISGNETPETIHISENGQNRCISKKHILKRNLLISEIIARTYIAGGYEMPLENLTAKNMGVSKRRYVNTVCSESRSILDTKKLFDDSNNAYEQYVIECNGCVWCDTDSWLYLENDERKMKITEISYILNPNEEKTRICAEVQI